MPKKPQKTYIYGKHALTEALLHAPQTVKKVFLAPNVDAPKLMSLIKKEKIQVSPLSTTKVSEKELRDASHQGVVAVVSQDGLMKPYDEFIRSLDVTDNTSLVLLDELQDPQNIGAVIRSAAAFGVSGVLIPGHNQAQVSGAVIKVSAGMAFRIPLIAIGNVNQVVGDLKKRGFWIYGLVGGGEQNINEEDFSAPSVIIIGNEGKGIREKTRELCDIRLSIPIHPQCESLNAAAATAVALSAWAAKHPNAVNIGK